MLTEHFLTAAAGARTTASLDETARLTWRAHAEAQILDAEAEAISEAIEARRAGLAGKGPAEQPRSALARPEAAMKRKQSGIKRARREKMFGLGRPRALDRNAKTSHHALGALPEPQDREGQSVWRRYGEGSGGA